MAWGYEARMTIEHDPTLKKRIDCKDCIHYDSSDKSCTKRPLYLPEDGYNSWRNCKYFEIDRGTPNYDAKMQQLSRKKNVVSKDVTTQKKLKPTEKVKNKKTVESPIVEVTEKECSKYKLIVATRENIPKKLSPCMLAVYLDDGRKKKVHIKFLDDKAYILENQYSQEIMEEVKRVFKHSHDKYRV